jgi:hypothetical protein
MQKLRWLLVLSLIVSAGAYARSVNPGDHVDNFRLMDHLGGSHELYYFSDMKAVALMIHDTSCRASESYVAKLNQVRDQYMSRGVQVFMLDSSLKDTRAIVQNNSVKLSNTVPVLLDPLQLVGESLSADRAGEVLIINPQNWTVAYRGSVDGVHEALEATLTDAAIKKPKQSVKGCAVRMPEMHRDHAHAKISYEKTIAPILSNRCVTCHRQGGIAPWQMSNYEIVRGFAPMMREVVRTQRMPPWHADPHFGVFSNNRALTDDETKALVHWVEAGAPHGKGDDPLAKSISVRPEWPLGEPDLIVEIPTFNVPATGAIPYQNPRVKNPLGHDAWVRAVDFAPTNRSVVHHILGFVTKPKAPNTDEGSADSAGGDQSPAAIANRKSLGTYVPGDIPHSMPRDTGVFLPKDADLLFQIHYTANGKPTAERTRIGLYFAKEMPKYPLRGTVLISAALKIPPHDKAYVATAKRTFDRDVILYTLMPHAHVRGSAAKYVARFPDGREETILSVPRYDFNWQTTYELATPRLLPKGTTLIYTGTYDNSSQNKANPDPNIEVRWGEQTWNEMLYGDITFRYLDETTESENKTASVSSAP